jgi:hypothetical protein
MAVYKGKDRMAVVGEKYVVKVARSHPKQFGRSLHQHIERDGIKEALDDWNRFDADQLGGMRRMLLHGIAANKREHRLAERFDRVVVPTATLLGGIVNIQPTAQAVDLDFTEIWGSFVDHLGYKVTKLGHMMEDTNNFGIYDNRVMFVDGGSDGLEDLLQTHAHDIEKSLGAVGTKLGLS